MSSRVCLLALQSNSAFRRLPLRLSLTIGITADANILINNARLSAQRYLYTYQESIPIEVLVQELCDLKQGYTQYGGLRPFGVSFLYAGWDKQYGFQLYASDPSGNYSGWKATAIGANSPAAQSIMKTDYKEDLSLKDAIQLAIKVLAKTMDSTTLTADKRTRCFRVFVPMLTPSASRVQHPDPRCSRQGCVAHAS